MRAILNNDIIVRWILSGGKEIGDPPAGRLGLDRLRYDGNKIIDIATRNNFFIETQNGAYILHVICPPGKKWSRVEMRYTDKKRLINDNGLIRVKTDNEIIAEQIRKNKIVNDKRAEKKLQKEIGSETEQKKIIDDLMYVIIDYIINKSSSSKQILEKYLENMNEFSINNIDLAEILAKKYKILDKLDKK